jgi:hypothetical protein
MVQRSRRVARRDQRPHQSQRGWGAEGLPQSKTARPLDRVVQTTLGASFAGQSLQRQAELLVQALPLVIDPPLKLSDAGYVNPVQERSPIELGGMLEPTGADRLLKLPHVAMDQGPIEPDPPAAGLNKGPA